MALGNNYSNNSNTGNNNKYPAPTYYSRFKIKNLSENISLGFDYWNGILKIVITETNNTNSVTNKPNELASVYLNPTKARILVEAVNRIIESGMNEDMAFGVDVGTAEVRGFIAVGVNSNVPYVFIGKVNPEGAYESSQKFEFNVDTNYILNVKDLTNLKVSKEYMNNIEILMFRDLLDDYARYANGAAGAAFYDIGRYENGKLASIIRKMAGANNTTYQRGNNTLFDSSSNGEYNAPKRPHTIDSLEDELD